MRNLSLLKGDVAAIMYARKRPRYVALLTDVYLFQHYVALMKCPYCGFRANRDEVPIHWAVKTTIALTAMFLAAAVFYAHDSAANRRRKG